MRGSFTRALSTLRGGGGGEAGPFDPRSAAEGPFGSIHAPIDPRMGYATKVLIAAFERVMRNCRVLAFRRHAIGIQPTPSGDIGRGRVRCALVFRRRLTADLRPRPRR